MSLKCILGAVLSAVLLCNAFTVQTFASTAVPHGISGWADPLYDIVSYQNAALTISGSTAKCRSEAETDGAVKITAVQYLQKQGLLWTWSTYDDAEWTQTVYVSRLTMSNTKTGLTSGKYRLKTVFTYTDKQGKTSTATAYSSEQEVG